MPDRDDISKAWKVPPSKYLEKRPAELSLPKQPFSRYAAMRDGVRLAVDVYLPQGEKAPAKFPAIIVATPYYRRFKTAGPVAEYTPMAFRYRDAFVPRGYALVVVDVRGTGASFGSRDSFRSPRERDDFAEIVQWIVEQAWSDGRVGATGISYPGAASLFIAGTGHPAVKAIAPLFAVNEIYGDQLYPGGMLSKVWTGTYNDCIVSLDHNRTEEIKKYAYFGEPNFRGPHPVDEDPDGALLAQAMEEHKQSFNLHDAAPELAFRGEGLLHDPSLTLEVCSPYHYYDQIRPEVAIYSCSGYFDGSGYSNAAICRFMTLARSNHHLVLGPWDHGARTNGSPWRDQQVPRFSLWGDVVRFFDEYLMGRTDNVARVVAQKLQPVLKQPVVVENRPGATGTIGTQAVIQAAPDGYTLLFMAASLHTFSPHLMKGMTFDTVADITPVTISVQFPYVLAVSAESPYRSVKDLIQAAKAQPGKLAYGSFGIGSGPNIISELFKQQTGIEVLHVPYKGGSQVTAALMGGEVPFMFDSLPSPLGQIRGGKLRALAVTSAQRAPAVPEVPTLIESGVNIEAIIWLGLGGPPKLPPEILNKLFEAMKQISTDPDLQKRMADMGAEATVSKSPEEFRQFMLSERDRWGKVIRDAKISTN